MTGLAVARTDAAVPRFGAAWWGAHRDSLRFVLACPLLAAVPVAVELVQHVVEVRIGMYDSLAAAKALDGDPTRMAFGFAKVLSLGLLGYWVMRFLAWGDPARVARWDPRAVRLFAGVLAYQAAVAAVSLFVLPRTGAALLAGFVVGAVLSALFAAWHAAAPLGNAALGPLASARVMAPRLAWTIGYMLAAMLPLMVVHYALAAAALVGPRALLWPVLIGDALLVGWLGALMLASGWYAARRAARLAGTDLDPAVGADAGDRLHRGA